MVYAGRILVADDDPSMTLLIAHRLRADGHEVVPVEDGAEAWALIQQRPFDLVITDLQMPGLDGLGLLARVRTFDEELPVLLLTGHSSVATAVEAMRQGAWDYVEKPVEPERLRVIVGRILDHRALQLRVRAADRADEQAEFHGMIGRSSSMQMLFQRIERVARYHTAALVIGASGTGKELVARALHTASDRSTGPFVAVNCAGVVDSLFESLFFGHEKGAFTGAQQAQKGWMAAAHGGVLFLDELGEMPFGQQAKLLRALERGEVVPVGATRPVPVDVRVVAATNRDLHAAIAGRSFREDLYYRLRGVELRVPGLAERRDDVPLLAEAFLARACAEFGRRLRGFEPEAMQRLLGWPWPGNVRELRQVVYAAAMMADGPWVGPADLQVDGRRAAPAAAAPSDFAPQPLSEVEREHVRRTLEFAGDNRTKAASYLGLSRHALYRLLKLHGLG